AGVPMGHIRCPGCKSLIPDDLKTCIFCDTIIHTTKKAEEDKIYYIKVTKEESDKKALCTL
ncbi:MAG: hypothetical protein LBD17_02660, partial [Endomicrobium sp.]|nr:hypothetical protein [Endomicrobium sp.]